MHRRTPIYALYFADATLSGNAAAHVAIPWFVLTTTGSAFIAIGVCYAAIVGLGFFNPAFARWIAP